MSEKREQFSMDGHRAVRDDHYFHWTAMLAAAGYAWQVHGLLPAAGVLIGLIVAISATNVFILARWGSLRAVNWSRWGWVILAFILIGASGASIEHVQ